MCTYTYETKSGYRHAYTTGSDRYGYGNDHSYCESGGTFDDLLENLAIDLMSGETCLTLRVEKCDAKRDESPWSAPCKPTRSED